VTSTPPAQHAEDALLIAAVASGDQAAMARLYDRFAPLVNALCLRMLRDRHAAEELFEDIFVELWRRSGQYDKARGSVATWIATITRSRGIDRIRARQRAGAVAMTDEAEQVAGDADPAEQVLAADERRRVNESLQALTPDQRRAIELAYFEGLSHSEIATRLARPLGTIKTHIRQGLIQLREVMRIPSGSASEP